MDIEEIKICKKNNRDPVNIQIYFVISFTSVFSINLNLFLPEMLWSALFKYLLHSSLTLSISLLSG